MQRLIPGLLTLMLALVLGVACGPAEPPVVPGTPDPFSSPLPFTPGPVAP